MITRGVISEKLDSCTYKIKLPALDKINSSLTTWRSDRQYTASVCLKLKCHMNLRQGDVVFVGFENNNRYKPIILGCLSKSSNSSSISDLVFNTLTVNGATKLSTDTKIGDIVYSNIECLQGLSDNFQNQVEARKAKNVTITAAISNLMILANSTKINYSSQSTAVGENAAAIDVIKNLLGKPSDESPDTLFGQLNILSNEILKIKNKLGDIPEDNTAISLIEDLRTRLDKLKASAPSGNTVPIDSANNSSNSQSPTVTADDSSIKSILAALKNKFPHKKYWNHMPNKGTGAQYNNQDGWTDIPCTKHNSYCGTSNQTCNGYAPSGYEQSWQCMGYAEKCGYDVSGYDPRSSDKWTKYTQSAAKDALAKIKPGDIVRCKNGGHSIFVTDVDDSTITYTDCNSDGHCIIKWGSTITKSDLMTHITEVNSCPKDLSNSRLLKK